MSLNYTSMKFSKNPYGKLLNYSVKALNVYRYNSNTNFFRIIQKKLTSISMFSISSWVLQPCSSEDILFFENHVIMWQMSYDK